jgi:hypothetical protein
MKKTYIAFEMKIRLLTEEDVITTSNLEKGVVFDGENWGTDGSWMDSANN